MNQKVLSLCLAIISCIFLIILTGCNSNEVIPNKGDFSFELLDGYIFSDVTAENCSIVRDQDNATVGGVEITNLEPDELYDDSSNSIMLYLQSEFHKTNNVEFIAFRWGDEYPIVSINLTKLEDDTEEKAHFKHVFFEQDPWVYHMWFDLDVIDQEVVDQLIPSSIKNGSKYD